MATPPSRPHILARWLLAPAFLLLGWTSPPDGLAPSGGAGLGGADGHQDQEVTPTPPPPEDKVERGLRSALLASPEQRASFLVYLSPRPDLSAAYAIDDWEARGRYVFETLQQTARTSQAGILESLRVRQATADVAAYQPYYIVNAIGVTAGLATLDALSARPEVAFIESMKEYPLPEPIEADPIGTLAVEWGVQRIGADRVWSELGVRGQGIVVANIDTGVQYTHPAVDGQYRGASTGSHDYNWFDPAGSTAPFDNNGHGTHTMGTMVGDDGGSNQVGIAPQAKWIAAKGCSTTDCSTEDLLASAQWILAPFPMGGSPSNGDPSKRPNVVNNSWGGPSGDLWYQQSVEAWRAADIFPAFAAGNSGPGGGSINSPGDYAESFATGATDSSDAIAFFSSRGPSSLTNETKPDVSAPGVSVRSAWNNGSYRTISGTSMASPHTAGCVALIRAANAGLSIAQVENLLTSTALDLGAAGPDNNYGFGRINCYAAVSAAIGQPTPTPVTFTPTPIPTRTFTATAPSPTSTPVTPTGTLSLTGTITPTPLERTATRTPTRTATPLVTVNTTPTATRTRTGTPTPTVTFTRTVTLTWTVTPSWTPTPTSVTATPVITASASPTNAPPSATSTPGVGVVFFDNFETDRGWIRNPSGTDTAITGLWARGDPQDTSYGGPMQLGNAVSGSNDLVTGPLAGSSVGDHDVDGGVTSIRSPDITLPSSGSLRLSFSFYLAHLNNASADDFLRVRAVGPASSATVFEELGSPDNDFAVWQSAYVILDAFAGQTIHLVIEAADAGTPSLVEAALDDVALTFVPSTPLPATGTPAVPTSTPVVPSPTYTTAPATSTPGVGVIFFDDFETDRGWVRNPFGFDNATTGLWVRSDPEDTNYVGAPMQLGTTVSGNRDLVTGPLAGAGVGSDDIDTGMTSIRSPNIVLPSSGDLRLSFSYYLAYLNNSSADDFLRLRVVWGSSSVTIFDERGAAAQHNASWAQKTSVSLNAFAGQTIYLLIEAADDGTASLVEAAIDDISITVGGP